MYDVFEQLIQKKGITPYKVSKETGVTQTALSNWKSGKSTPTTKTLQKIADYLGVTIDYLMTGEEKKEANAYYLNEETAATAQKIFEDDKVLFDVYRSTDKERLVEYAKKLKALRDMEEGSL